MAAGFSFDLWVMAISLFSWWSVWSINNPFFFGLSSEDSHAGHVNKFLQAADLELLSQQEEQGKPGEKSAVAFVFSGGFQGEIPYERCKLPGGFQEIPYKRCVLFGDSGGVRYLRSLGSISPAEGQTSGSKRKSTRMRRTCRANSPAFWTGTPPEI